MEWKDWKFWAKSIVLVYAIYSFIILAIILIRSFTFNPNLLSNFGTLSILKNQPYIQPFSILFFISIVVAILFMILAISLWKNYRAGIVLGILPFIWNVYRTITGMINFRGSTEPELYWSFKAIQHSAIFVVIYLIIICFLVFISIKRSK